MADPTLPNPVEQPPLDPTQRTPELKAATYHSISQVNQGLLLTLNALQDLEKTGFIFTVYFNRKLLNEFAAMLQEVYSDLNHSFASCLAEIELTDAGRFQKVRLDREKR